ncbi:MAG: EamA family transporter [Flavobacteriaceae bacterium]|nr:EamA family transporter [Flavobacteriaceae bacterium]
MKNEHLQHLLQLGFASFCISTSSVLGRYIDMPSPVTIWWRSALALIALYIFCRIQKIDLRLPKRKDLGSFLIGGIFLGAHWVTYFYALKMSNVAIGVLSLYTFPVITALLEPLFIKTKFNPIHLILGIMVLIGIYILVPEFDFENSYVQGALLGVCSAILYAIRSLLLKRHIANYNSTMLMWYQLLIISIFMAPVLITMDTSSIGSQFPYVLILALITTALGHTLFVKSLRYFSVSTASIISSLQPLYGISMAFFFLNEIPTWNILYGGLLIISTVVIESI